MTNELSQETLKIDMDESVERVFLMPNKRTDRIVEDFKKLSLIGLSCEDYKKLERLFK